MSVSYFILRNKILLKISLHWWPPSHLKPNTEIHLITVTQLSEGFSELLDQSIPVSKNKTTFADAYQNFESQITIILAWARPRILKDYRIPKEAPVITDNLSSKLLPTAKKKNAHTIRYIYIKTFKFTIKQTHKLTNSWRARTATTRKLRTILCTNNISSEEQAILGLDCIHWFTDDPQNLWLPTRSRKFHLNLACPCFWGERETSKLETSKVNVPYFSERGIEVLALTCWSAQLKEKEAKR